MNINKSNVSTDVEEDMYIIKILLKMASVLSNPMVLHYIHK